MPCSLLELLVSGGGGVCVWFDSTKSSWLLAMLLKNWRSSGDVKLSFTSSPSPDPLPSSHWRHSVFPTVRANFSAELQAGWALVEEKVAGEGR